MGKLLSVASDSAMSGLQLLWDTLVAAGERELPKATLPFFLNKIHIQLRHHPSAFSKWESALSSRKENTDNQIKRKFGTC